MAQKLDLDAFYEAAIALHPDRDDILSFVMATRRAQMEGEEGFIGPQYEYRTIEDWWAEVEAYNTYTKLAGVLTDDRRREPTVERRQSTRLRITDHQKSRRKR